MGDETQNPDIGGMIPYTTTVAMVQNTEATFLLPEKCKKFSIRPRSRKAFLLNVGIEAAQIAAGDYFSMTGGESFGESGLWTLKGSALFFQNAEVTDVMEITYWL